MKLIKLPRLVRGAFFSTLLVLPWTGAGQAHTPYMACFDNGDGTITCNGEFSDGASAAGVSMQVTDGQGRTLHQGRMDDDGEFRFPRPEVPFIVIFDAGPGHVVRENSDTIVP
jgi:hypothetical protein